jgi:tRNA A-37 threonylcarbamoyl transferase component Bud32
MTEMRFSQYLGGKGVPTVRALAAARTKETEWLITEAVRPAEPAEEWHVRNLQRGVEGRRAIRKAMIDLARALAKMHSVGVLHCDLHAGNIMIRTDTPDPQCVLMDLHRMKKAPWISRRAKAMNLAQLLHDRYEWTTRSERLLFLKHYLSAARSSGTLRGWRVMIEQFAERHRHRLYAQRDRRVFANNRYFHKIALPNFWSGHVVLSSKRRTPGTKAGLLDFHHDQWIRALTNPERLIAGGITKLVKDSPSAVIVQRKLIVGDHELDVIIKRPRRKQPWKVLLDCFRQARPIRAFALGHALLTRRIPTAIPLVALQRRFGLLLLDSILITEAHDAPQLDQFLNEWLTETDNASDRLPAVQRRHLGQEVLHQMGRILQKLHDNSFRHRDLKSANMLVEWSPGQKPEIVLVDLDGLRRVQWLTVRRRFPGLMRLNVSLLRCQAVNHAGQLRMLLGYLRRAAGGPVQFKPYWRMLENWSARKLRRQIHSRRKRQRAIRR